MKFLVVSSPHAFTTRDVWKRVIAGLAANGAEALAFDLLPRWSIFDALLKLGEKAKIELPEGFYTNMLTYDLALGSALIHEVDAVVIVSPQYCPMTVIQALRKAGKKTIAYFTECPYEDTGMAPQQAAFFDYSFVNDRNSVEMFRSFCPNVFYMPHSFDAAIHYPDVAPAESDRVLFIGTGYKNRVDFLRRIDWAGINLELYGIWWLRKRARLHAFLKGKVIENEETAGLYRASAASFSIHRAQRFGGVAMEIDDNEAYSAGPRTWELAACGTFQVSDHRQEIVDVFGDAMPFYDTPKELERLLRRAVDDPVWRQEMAAKQREAVQGRDCAATMRTMLEAVA